MMMGSIFEIPNASEFQSFYAGGTVELKVVFVLWLSPRHPRLLFIVAP